MEKTKSLREKNKSVSFLKRIPFVPPKGIGERDEGREAGGKTGGG